MRFALIYVCLALGACVHSTAAQTETPEDPEANPGRPTVSTPATLTPAGYLQFETGGIAANHSPEWRLANRQSGDWRSRARDLKQIAATK